MLKKVRWYQVLRFIMPFIYTFLLIKGFMTKSLPYMAVFLGITVLGGAWFCGWMCPFGFIQEWTGRLARLFRVPQLRIHRKVERWLRFLRYLLLILSLAGFSIVLFVQSSYGSFMGIVDENVSFITKSALILMGCFIGSSLFIDRLFCRYFCPEGARYGILSLLRVFSIKRSDESCISCKKCDKKCPTQIVVSEVSHVRDGQCVNCMECISVCPVKKTLSFGCILKK